MLVCGQETPNSCNCSSHNFFWYENPSTRKLHLIPWDLDNAFENIIFHANPVTPIADAWGESTNDCRPFNYGSWGLRQWSASCDKLTNGWVQYDALYQDKIRQLKEGPMAESKTDELLDRWSQQIYSATEEASLLHGDAIGISAWQNAINELKAQLSYARRK